jgi:hypothetical protein
MIKNLTIVFGLLASLSACAAPYGYTGYGDTGYGYSEPTYYGYSNQPVYTDPAIHTSANTVRCNDVDVPFSAGSPLRSLLGVASAALSHTRVSQ